MAPILTTGVGTRVVASGGGGGTTVWRGADIQDLVGSGKIQTATINTGTHGPTRRVIMVLFGADNPTQSVVDVKVNGISLTSRATDGGSGSMYGAVYDNIVNAADTGAGNVVVTWNVATQQAVAFMLWTATALSTGFLSGGVGASYGINVTAAAGDNIFWGAVTSTPGDYAISSEPPDLHTAQPVFYAVQSAGWMPVIGSYPGSTFQVRHNAAGGQLKGMYGIYR
jgi:hypothetical protein